MMMMMMMMIVWLCKTETEMEGRWADETDQPATCFNTAIVDHCYEYDDGDDHDHNDGDDHDHGDNDGDDDVYD